MKKIEEYYNLMKKYKKLSIILGSIVILPIILLFTGNTFVIIISILTIIILGGLSSTYHNKCNELEEKIEYMKLHEEIIQDTKEN